LAAFGLVILVTLLSAGSAVVWLVQEYQRRLAVDRLTEIALAAALVGRQLEQQEARPEDIGAALDTQFAPAKIGQARILIVDAQGRVLAEKPAPAGGLEPAFAGRKLEVPAPDDRSTHIARQFFFRARATVWTDATEAQGKPFIFVTAPLPAGPGPGPGIGPGPSSGTGASSGAPNGAPGGAPAGQAPPPVEPRPEGGERTAGRRQQQYRVVLAVPQRNLASAWRELAPSLGLAALIAVPASVAAALWLSRSITRPLRQITGAAEGIARGELRQTIPVRGRDEVAHLAQAFNIMSQEVERSHRALRDFLANASHELRTPLTSIQGFSQALLDQTLRGDEGAAEAGRIINEEAERMQRLVEDLLYLSRVESREVPASRAAVDVAALIREAGRRLQLVAERRRLQVTLDLPDLPPVPGDADELDRLFGNLLDNAGKYTPEGGAVTVAGRTDAGQVRVTVHNSGSVIPPEDLPHIFERFYRVDKSRARDVEGSGLGLAIAREVAQRHGGTIAASSGRGAGTTFEVILPLSPPGLPDGRAWPGGAGPQARRPASSAPAPTPV
jgi:signal transduction histidine kinase